MPQALNFLSIVGSGAGDLTLCFELDSQNGFATVGGLLPPTQLMFKLVSREGGLDPTFFCWYGFSATLELRYEPHRTWPAYDWFLSVKTTNEL